MGHPIDQFGPTPRTRVNLNQGLNKSHQKTCCFPDRPPSEHPVEQAQSARCLPSTSNRGPHRTPTRQTPGIHMIVALWESLNTYQSTRDFLHESNHLSQDMDYRTIREAHWYRLRPWRGHAGKVTAMTQTMKYIKRLCRRFDSQQHLDAAAQVHPGACANLAHT